MFLKRFGRSLALALTASLVLSTAVPGATVDDNSQLQTMAGFYTETESTEEPVMNPSEQEESEKPEEPVETGAPSTEGGEHNQEQPSTETGREQDTEQPSAGGGSEAGTEQPSTGEGADQGSEIPDIDLPGIHLPTTEMPDPNSGTELEGSETDSDLFPGIDDNLPGGFPGEELGEDPNFNLEEEVTEEENVLNEDLINAQHIIMPDLTELYEEFRFTQDPSAIRVILKKGARVYEEAAQTALVIGRSYTGSVAYILDTVLVDMTMPEGETGAVPQKEKWYYIESGSVRGFVPETALITGLDAAAILLDTEAVERFRDAECTVRPIDNQALTYNRKTAGDPVAEKVYAIADKELSILSDRNPSAEDIQVLGTLPKGGLAYILADQTAEMVYVESNDVRGFVAAADLITGDQAAARVKKQGENNLKQATEEVAPEDNPALYYTLTSTRRADSSAALRKAIVEFALQFQGNPYVWGGTSLTQGTDCSGFVMQIYRQFGYSLPRTSRYQSQYGTQIPVSAAIPGDLLFFAKDGVVHHVAMYIGDGKMIHAKGRAYGIVVSNVGQRAVWATRILP